MIWYRTGIIGIVAVLVCWESGLVWGQSASCPDMDGVPSADRDWARVLAKAATREHKQLKYKRAAELYRDAAKLWPRPELYRQAGMAYAQAVELLPAYQHLEHALRCGQGVLSAQDFKDAEEVMDRLRPWFAELEVHCQQPGLAVRLDGASWFVCPAGAAGSMGVERQIVMVGQHEVVARKDGHVDMRAPVLLTAGQRAVVEARLVPDAQKMVATRRWARWKPWAVVGGALGLAAVGGGLQLVADWRRDGYEAVVAADCVEECAGEAAGEWLQGLDRAIVENRVALGAFAVSGVGLAAGLTLLYLNRSRLRANPDAGRGKVRVISTVSRGGVSVALRLGF